VCGRVSSALFLLFYLFFSSSLSLSFPPLFFCCGGAPPSSRSTRRKNNKTGSRAFASLGLENTSICFVCEVLQSRGAKQQQQKKQKEKTEEIAEGEKKKKKTQKSKSVWSLPLACPQGSVCATSLRSLGTSFSATAPHRLSHTHTHLHTRNLFFFLSRLLVLIFVLHSKGCQPTHLVATQREGEREQNWNRGK
jgi:hypothetical protein